MANQGRSFGSFKQSVWAKPELGDIDGQPGIYVGEIKQIVTGSRNGAIKVYIPVFGGDPDDENGWLQVSYASPFLGSTPGYNDVNQTNSYEIAKQSYGFFMTPPDPGNQVLCCFPPGRGSIGVWFACISNNLSKYSIPAAAPSTSWENIDPTSLATGFGASLQSGLVPGVPYPVGDFNDLDPKTAKADWIKNLRPINPTSALQLILAGLDKDITRGAITSSIQRDPVSTVFGINTPGRPFPSQDTKNVPNLKQQIETGQFNPRNFQVTGRVPGHSFLLDDGDLYGKNNLVRLKTAAGHQLLMNDSEGFIYISNSTGTAWVELTAQGDVLIYNSRDLSIRTQGNIQMHSDRDIMINASRFLKLNGGAVQIEGSQLCSVVSLQNLSLFGGQTAIKGRSRTSISSGGAMSISSAGGMRISGSTIGLNSGGGGEPPSPQLIPKYLNADSFFAENQWVVRTNSLQSICYRVPTHEPYVRANISQLIEIQQEGLENVLPDSNITTVTGETVASIPITSSQTLEFASAEDVENPAPTSAFISQPDPGIDIGALSSNDYRAYLAQTAFASSGDDYATVNEFGFAGRYQFSSEALQSLGLIKPGTTQTLEALNNPNNWIGGSGKPTSLEDFLASPELQESAMNSFTTNNYGALQAAGVINSATPKDQIAGLLSISHYASPAIATSWYVGQIPNPEVYNQFYQQGAYSQSQVPVIVSSSQSKVLIGA